MKSKTKFLNGFIFLILLFIGLSAAADDKGKPSLAQFMQRVRTPPSQKTWAQLDGVITNMKRDKDGKRIITKSEIYLGIRFSSEMIFAQVIIGDNEIYSVGQPYSMIKSGVTVMREGDKESNRLRGNFGIKPEDLTMSFLFWNVIKELPEDSLKLIPCRVFLLISPDKSEIARVHISRDNYFPVKVEWSKSDESKQFTEATRTLEVLSFKKVNGLYLVNVLSFYGPGWRTKIEFSNTQAGYVKDGTPKGLFKDNKSN